MQKNAEPQCALLPPPSPDHAKTEIQSPDNSFPPPPAELCAGEPHFKPLFMGRLCAQNASNDTTTHTPCGGEPVSSDGANDFCRFCTGPGGIVAGNASPKHVGGQRSPSSHRFWHGHQGREDRNERRSSRFGHRRAVDGTKCGTRSGDGLSGPSPTTKTAPGTIQRILPGAAGKPYHGFDLRVAASPRHRHKTAPGTEYAWARRFDPQGFDLRVTVFARAHPCKECKDFTLCPFTRAKPASRTRHAGRPAPDLLPRSRTFVLV